MIYAAVPGDKKAEDDAVEMKVSRAAFILRLRPGGSRAAMRNTG